MRKLLYSLLLASSSVFAQGTGLVGSYYNNETLTDPVVLTRTERPHFTWTGSPGTGVNTDNFSVKWEGRLIPTVTGTYTLQTYSDSGMRVYLDNTLVISHWTAHAAAYKAATPMVLTAGQTYQIRVESHDDTGTAIASFKWKQPGASSFVVVPLSVLYPPLPPAIPYPLPAPQGTWSVIATDGQNFNLPTLSTVRFGPSTDYQYRFLKGSFTCSSDNMGWWNGWVNVCEVFTPTGTTNLVQHPQGGPMIDLSLIPPGSAGTSELRVRNTAEMPSQSDGTGAFRTTCDYSFMAFDDPIVRPNEPGASHLHTFFGNAGTNAASTVNSIATTGNSTCRGGIANRSSYWIPTMIDTRNGRPMPPNGANFYYKTGYGGVVPSTIQPLPAGLRMVAGDMHNTTAAGTAGYFECLNGGENLGRQPHVLNCPLGSYLQMSIFFPQCWDGVNLDSADHKSHMAFPNGGCPASHPVPLTEISFHIAWKVQEAGAPAFWRLSSDHHEGVPSGYSMHADWFHGWRQTELQLWVTQCNQPAKDCHSHLLGAGKEIF